jgi:hypothetical protein
MTVRMAYAGVKNGDGKDGYMGCLFYCICEHISCCRIRLVDAGFISNKSVMPTNMTKKIYCVCVPV